MIKSNPILKVSSDEYTTMLDNTVLSDTTYQKAHKQYQDVLALLNGPLPKNIQNDIDSEVTYMEALAREICFREGLNFGMQLMLSLLAGKGVVEFE